MVDQLAQDYAGQPVVFIEDYYAAPKGNRYSRFWAAHGAGSAYFPLIIVDSGHQVYDGPTQFYDTYKSMVDAELARAPLAEVSAVQQRAGSRLQFDVTVKNLSGVTLSSANSATVHVLVYEDARVGVTGRYMRAAPYQAISTPLANNATTTFHLETEDLNNVDWSKLHAVALVDYRPGGSSGPYDTLQAAVAVAAYWQCPAEVRFMVDISNPVDEQQQLVIEGAPSTLTWTVTENLPWLTVTPASGTVGQPATLQITAGSLAPGWQSGTLRVTVSGAGINDQEDVSVTAYLGEVGNFFLPFIQRK